MFVFQLLNFECDLNTRKNMKGQAISQSHHHHENIFAQYDKTSILSYVTYTYFLCEFLIEGVVNYLKGFSLKNHCNYYL